MKRGFIILFLGFILIGIVSGANDSLNDSVDNNISKNQTSGESPVGKTSVLTPPSSESASSTKLTSNFYFAVGVALVGLLIVLYILYSINRKPKNKWK